MIPRRRQTVPWRAAGTRAESRECADEVVRETGWVFNNLTGDSLSLEGFVATGDAEVEVYLDRFGWAGDAAGRSLLEIGSGIGRMTAALTRRYRRVVAADLDAAFLERCRETVSRFGDALALETLHIADGHTVGLADRSVDDVLSYITLQHCGRRDALGLTREAFRVAAPGGRVALNFRTWTRTDALLVPAGAVVRAFWRLPVVGGRLARWRWSTRLGWQANRLGPREILAALEALGVDLDEVVILHHPGRPQPEATHRGSAVAQRDLDVAHKSHWWLLARCR